MDLGWSSQGGETMREHRSGFHGLGGRPSLHPAWSGAGTTVHWGLLGGAAPSSVGDVDPRSDKKVHLS